MSGFSLRNAFFSATILKDVSGTIRRYHLIK